MTVIERSAVIEVLVAANGEGFREFYEKDATYGHPAVDRAMAAAEPLAVQLRGAVDLLRELSERWSDVRVSGLAARVAALEDAMRRARELTDLGGQ